MNFYQKPPANRFSAKALRILLAFGAFLGGGLIYGFFTAGEIYNYQDSVARGNLPEVDAIVCLAGGRGRIGLAGDIWLQYWEADQAHSPGSPTVPTLYLAGVGPMAHWSQVLKQFRPQVQKVILADQVLIENESLNTVANAVWLSDYAQRHHWKRILLMTSTYHMKRAQLIFRRVLTDRKSSVQLDTLSVFQDPFSSSHWRSESVGLRVTLLEYVKWLYYRFLWNGE